jgi:hypothetical protein
MDQTLIEAWIEIPRQRAGNFEYCRALLNERLLLSGFEVHEAGSMHRVKVMRR